MAGLNFPSNPNVGDSYSIGTRTWIWNGSAWQLQSAIQSLDPFTVKTLVVTSTTNSTSTLSGSVIVAGGVGIGETVYIGQDLHVLGQLYATVSGSITTASNLSGGFAGAIPYQTASGQTSYSSGLTFTNGILYVGTQTVVPAVIANTASILSITSQIISVNTLTVNNLETDFGNLKISSTLSSTSTTTGALTVAGGVGIGGDLWVGGAAYIGGSLILDTANLSSYAVTSLIAGTDTAVSTSTGAVTIWDSSTLQSVTNRGATTNNAVKITNTTTTTSTNTGALTIAGGVGIGGDLYVGGTFYAGGQAVLTTASFVSAISSGTDISITTTGTSTIVINDVSTLQSVTGRGATTTNVIYLTSTSPSTSPTSGALQVTGGVGIQGNLNVGGSTSTFAGNIGLSVKPSQWNTSQTQAIEFTAGAVASYSSGSSGWMWFESNGYVNSSFQHIYKNTGTWALYTINAGKHQWWTAPSGSAGAAVAAPYSTTPYMTLDNNGKLAIGTVTATSLLTVAGNVSITGVTTVSNNSSATSTVSGALQVVGGVGIGGDLYVGNTINVNREIADPPAINVDTSVLTIDSFSAATYRSARYLISISNSVEDLYETSEVWLVHDGINASIEETSVMSTGSLPLINFSAIIISGQVLFQAMGAASGNVIKVQTTYITV